MAALNNKILQMTDLGRAAIDDFGQLTPAAKKNDPSDNGWKAICLN